MKREICSMKKELEALIRKHNLINRTFDSFWKNYDRYIIEEPEESAEIGVTNRDSIEAGLYGYSYVISKAFNSDHIKVEIEMVLQSNKTQVGSYWCIFDLSGNCKDDYFVINSDL